MREQAGGGDSQLTTMPNSTPATKSHTVMQIMMLAIVMYSILLTLCRVSHSASFTRSMPSTKISARTTITAAFRHQKQHTAYNEETHGYKQSGQFR